MNEFGVFRPQELTKTSEQLRPKLKLSLDTRSHRLSMDSRSKHDRVEVQSKVDAPTVFDVSRPLVVSQPLAGTKNRYRYSMVIPVLEPPPVLETRTDTAIATGTGFQYWYRRHAWAPQDRARVDSSSDGGEALLCCLRRNPTRPTARTVGPPIVLAIVDETTGRDR